MNEEIGQIIVQLQETAPLVWESAIGDAYLGAVGYAAWAFILGYATFRAWRFDPRRFEGDSFERNLAGAARWAVLILASTGSVSFAYESLTRVLFTELQAYKTIVSALQ